MYRYRLKYRKPEYRNTEYCKHYYVIHFNDVQVKKSELKKKFYGSLKKRTVKLLALLASGDTSDLYKRAEEIWLKILVTPVLRKNWCCTRKKNQLSIIFKWLHIFFSYCRSQASLQWPVKSQNNRRADSFLWKEFDFSGGEFRRATRLTGASHSLPLGALLHVATFRLLKRSPEGSWVGGKGDRTHSHLDWVVPPQRQNSQTPRQHGDGCGLPRRSTVPWYCR